RSGAAHAAWLPSLCPPSRHASSLPSRFPFLFPLPLLIEPATPATSTLSLHDALPICAAGGCTFLGWSLFGCRFFFARSCRSSSADRKSTRLNSSHVSMSYAGLCLKKKNPPWRYARAVDSRLP